MTQAQGLETLTRAAARLDLDRKTLRSRILRYRESGAVWPRLAQVETTRTWVAPQGVWDTLGRLGVRGVRGGGWRKLPAPTPEEARADVAALELEARQAVVRPVVWSGGRERQEVGRGRAIHCARCEGNVLYERGEGEWRCMACGRVWEPRQMVREAG